MGFARQMCGASDDYVGGAADTTATAKQSEELLAASATELDDCSKHPTNYSVSSGIYYGRLVDGPTLLSKLFGGPNDSAYRLQWLDNIYAIAPAAWDAAAADWNARCSR